MAFCFLAIAGAACVVAATFPAEAQDRATDAPGPEGDVSLLEARAQALFERAVAALRRGRAAEGRDLLRQSLSILPTVATRFNLGVALRRTGEVTEAKHVFEALLLEATVSDRDRRQIAVQLAGIRREIATINVGVDGNSLAQGDVAVEVDGFAAGEVAPGESLRIEIDPGRHRVTALTELARGSEEIVAERGDHLALQLSLTPISELEGDGNELPWILGIAAGTLLAGAAVAVLIVTRGESAQPDPLVDDFTGLVCFGACP